MPGFVDVSNMSNLEIKRLGQADDDVDFGSTPARRNTVLQTGHSVSDVWAAACAAQRVNGGYYKEHEFATDDQRRPQIIKRKNREVMLEFLYNPDRLLTEDVEAGEQVRDFLSKDISLRALKGQLTDFDQSVIRCLAITDRFYTVTHRYEMAVIASLPSSANRSQQRQDVTERMQFARGGLIGQPGDKVTTNAEVVISTYSPQYNMFWIRAITDQDQPVMFGNKQKFDAGTHLTIQGKVKAHKDNVTQLNYVKVL
jgi:hypothetical protein